MTERLKTIFQWLWMAGFLLFAMIIYLPFVGVPVYLLVARLFFWSSFLAHPFLFLALPFSLFVIGTCVAQRDFGFLVPLYWSLALLAAVYWAYPAFLLSHALYVQWACLWVFGVALLKILPPGGWCMVPYLGHCTNQRQFVSAVSIHTGILLAVAVPKTSFYLRHTMEDGGRENLSSVRAALELYHRDSGGRYPSELAALTSDGKWLQAMPVAKTPNYHSDNSAVQLLDAEQFNAGRFGDAGGWAYVIDGPSSGSVLVNCTHTDSKGKAWTGY